MRSRIIAWFLMGLLLLLTGCGGGGGAGGGPTTVTLSGLVESISNFGAPVPAASVQVGTTNVLTGTDGSFSITAPKGTSSLLVVFTPAGGSPISFRFDFDPATTNIDLGTLSIGPAKITATGRVLDQTTNLPLSGARVVLGGVSTLTSATGTFTLTDVAYDSTRPGNFFGIEGRAGKSGYFPRLFFPENGPSGGVANLGDLTILPDSGVAPPGTPFNIEGVVGPAGSASGVTLTLRIQGGASIRQFSVGADRRYGFWVAPGTYILSGTKSGSSLVIPDTLVTLTSPVATVRQDVTLQ